MHRFRDGGGTMTHATSWNAQATGEAPPPRCSAVEVGPVAPHGRAPRRRGGEFRLSLVAGLPPKRNARPGRQADAGTPAATLAHGEAAVGEDVDARGAAGRVPDGSLDAATRDRSDSPAVRCPVSHRTCLEGTDGGGMELPEARASRGRARRGRQCSVDAARLAADKKTPRAAAPISCSSMK